VDFGFNDYNIPRVMTKLGAMPRLAMDERSDETANSAPTVCKLPVSEIALTSL
jgi:hypothetical protein